MTLMFLFGTGSLSMAEGVEGYWIKESNDVIVKVNVVNGQLVGRLLDWKDRNLKWDSYNPDPSLRGRALKGLPVLYGLAKNGPKWGGGTIYDATQGKTYGAKLWLENPNVMVVRGFLGVSVLGKTTKWMRTAKTRL